MPYANPSKRSDANRRWYERNKAKCIAKAAADASRLYDEYKRKKDNQPCMDCKVPYPWYILQYDHRPGEVKLGNVAHIAVRGTRRKLEAEIAKCDLVCANCHAERTHRR